LHDISIAYNCISFTVYPEQKITIALNSVLPSVFFVFGFWICFGIPWYLNSYPSTAVSSTRLIFSEKKIKMSSSHSPRRQDNNLVVATRLHLGNAATPPDATKTEEQITAFARLVATSCPKNTTKAIIAVDATPKVEGYDYVQAIRDACKGLKTTHPNLPIPQVLPVTPWGKFVPALNAIIAVAVKEHDAKLLLFVSAETTASPASIQTLCENAEPDDTLVAGALLGGHIHQHQNNHTDACSKVDLTGRTSPWNTLSVWKLSKLALTGFQLVSEGLLTDDDTEPSYGIEEVVAIAMLQKLLGTDQAKAKLIKLPGIEWDQVFEDAERRNWHERKMMSKVDRADRQLKLTGLTGSVYHC